MEMEGIYYVKKGNMVTVYNVPWAFVRELQEILGDNVEDFDKLLNEKFKVSVRVSIYGNKEITLIKELIERYEEE